MCNFWQMLLYLLHLLWENVFLLQWQIHANVSSWVCLWSGKILTPRHVHVTTFTLSYLQEHSSFLSPESDFRPDPTPTHDSPLLGIFWADISGGGTPHGVWWIWKESLELLAWQYEVERVHQGLKSSLLTIVLPM